MTQVAYGYFTFHLAIENLTDAFLNCMALLAMDLGATKLASAVFTEDGSMITQEKIALAGRTGADVGSLISERIEHFLGERGELGDDISSIGICVPGISHADEGTVWAPNVPGWEDFPLLEVMRASAGTTPVAIDSDRACSILGELWQGAAIGCRDAIFMAVGTGIGAGILVDGKVLRGSHDIGGAIGWMALERPYASKFNASGNFETLASGEGIVRSALELLATSPDNTENRILDPEKPFTSHDVFEAYELGDPIALKVLEGCVELWGMAIANLVSLFNPEKIILGGGVFGPAIKFIPAIYAEAAKWAQPISMKQVSLEPSSLGNHAGLFGAGLLAMQNVQS
jgi:glucokinase